MDGKKIDWYDEDCDIELEKILEEKPFCPEELERLHVVEIEMLEAGLDGAVMGLLEAPLEEQEEQHGEEINNLGGLDDLIWEGAGQPPGQGRGALGARRKG